MYQLLHIIPIQNIKEKTMRLAYKVKPYRGCQILIAQVPEWHNYVQARSCQEIILNTKRMISSNIQYFICNIIL